MHDNGLSQVVDKPTREKATLDLVLMNTISCLNRVETLPPLADHDTVLVEADIRAQRVKPTPRKVYIWRKSNWEDMRHELEAFCQEYMAMDKSSLHCNDIWLLIKTKLHDLLKAYVPSKLIKDKFSVPWVDNEVRRLIRRRERFQSKNKHRRFAADVSDKAKDLKRIIQRKIRAKYWAYVNDLILGLNDPDSNTSEPNSNKKFFSFLKHQRSESSGVAPLKDQGLLISNSTGKANLLNKQFVSVFSAATSNHQPNLGPSPLPSMPPIAVSVPGVLKLLLGIQPHKAAGPDEIHARLLKELAPQLAPVLADFFQRSLNSGQVPDDWREANIAPVFKKGDKARAANYRPISLTSITCKILEHIIASSVMRHLEGHSILYDLQHGFRRSRSCETQLLSLYNDLTSSRNNRTQTDLIVMDFAKAFDKVSHRLLALKLEFYGIRGEALAWISNFLANRTQRVLVEGTSSETAAVTSGVPQGTVLGPILFLAFINDLPSWVKNSKVRLFADDCFVQKEIRTPEDCVLLQEDITKIGEWEQMWQMEFNAAKCEALTIPASRRPIVHTYHLHGTTLERPPSGTIKYLGVNIQADLKWTSHIEQTTAKASRTLGMLRRNIKIRDTAPRELAYKALVRPQLEYASSIWDPPRNQLHDSGRLSGLAQKVEMVQRRAARFVSRRYHNTSSVSDMLDTLGWPTLAERRRTNRLTMFYKISNNLVAIPSSDLIPAPNRTRGHSKRYQPIRASVNCYANSFFPRTIPEWNSLPESVVASDTLSQFKNELARASYP